MDNRPQQPEQPEKDRQHPRTRQEEGSPNPPEFSDPSKEILTPSGDQTQAMEE